jgi:hypothetical protein
MSSRTSSTTAQSSTLRPRAPRLISGLDDEAPAILPPIVRHASPLPSPFDSREPSPMPTTRLPRTGSSQTLRHVTSMSRLNPGRAQSPATLSAFFGDSWSAIQGMASETFHQLGHHTEYKFPFEAMGCTHHYFLFCDWSWLPGREGFLNTS